MLESRHSTVLDSPSLVIKVRVMGAMEGVAPCHRVVLYNYNRVVVLHKTVAVEPPTPEGRIFGTFMNT